MSVWRRRLRALRRLSRTEAVDLVAAQTALLQAQLRLWRRPLGQLVASLPAQPEPLPPPEREAAVRAEAQRVAIAVERAAEHGLFRPRCLVRALALQAMLEARKIQGGRIRIGVHRGADQFSAHAWIEYGDQVLGDSPAFVRRFVPVSDFTAVASR